MDTSFWTLVRNPSFWSPFFAWLLAQVTKLLVNIQQTRRVDLSCFVRMGGMPSAHSSMVWGLATAVGLRAGFGTAAFAIALGFALITIFDASTVRRSAGLQAKLLNEIVDELFKEHHFSERKLVELLGHTRLEVFLGTVMGILTALIVDSVPVLVKLA